MVQWFNGAMVQWCNGLMVQWWNGLVIGLLSFEAWFRGLSF